MKNRLIVNRFWLWKALETYTLGIYFILRKDLFEPPYDSVLNQLDGPIPIIILFLIGTITIVYVLWDVKSKRYKALMSGAITFVWLFFFCSFVTRDFTIMTYISIQSIYAFYVLVSIIFEVVAGRR